MNVLDFAIKMEVEGKALYEELARGAALPGLKNIFLQLAADEEKHREVVSALKTGAPPSGMEDTPVMAQAKTVFADLLAHRESFGPVKNGLDAYRRAMKLEADSFRLYEDAAREEIAPAVKALLLRVAGEEQKHFTILRNVYDFANAPSQYLAWGEFSNLEEFRQFGRDVD